MEEKHCTGDSLYGSNVVVRYLCVAVFEQGASVPCQHRNTEKLHIINDTQMFYATRQRYETAPVLHQSLIHDKMRTCRGKPAKVMTGAADRTKKLHF